MKPYNPDACCGADCFAFGLNPSEKCWGYVEVAAGIYLGDEEGNVWIHECEGHSGCFEDGQKFKPQPPDKDQCTEPFCNCEPGRCERKESEVKDDPAKS